MAFKTIEAMVAARRLLDDLFEHFEGSPTKVARVFEKTPSEAIEWRKRGYISRPALRMLPALIDAGKLPAKFADQVNLY